MTRDTLLSYPIFNEEFKIHTNDIKFQLGAVIIQKYKLITFCSRKLTDAQKRYTVIEKEIPSIVENLK